mmetsp:Transcript_16772/g.50028  ORF Transcript_16772/g.50028 Transcript_16772/m.50028 type:complete len:350 (-) Transcript_16772:595-1644(-)
MLVDGVEGGGEAGERLAHLGRGGGVGLVALLVELPELVVDAERDEVLLDRPHEQRLDLRPLQHRDRVRRLVDRDCQVEPLHLLQHPQRDQPAERQVVLAARVRRGQLGEHGRRGGGQIERHLLPLDERVQLAHLGRRGLEQPAGDDLREEGGARGGGGEGEHLRHPLCLLVLEVVLQQVEVEDGGRGRHRQRRQHRARRERRQLRLGGRRLERLSGGVRARERVGVEEAVAGHPKDLRELRVIRGHRRGLGRLLHEQRERVDVLDSAVRLLPQLHLDGGRQLAEASLEVHLQRLWRRRLAVLPLRVHLSLRVDVVAEDLAQAAELDGALVGLAKLEGLCGGVAVELLEL